MSRYIFHRRSRMTGRINARDAVLAGARFEQRQQPAPAPADAKPPVQLTFPHITNHNLNTYPK